MPEGANHRGPGFSLPLFFLSRLALQLSKTLSQKVLISSVEEVTLSPWLSRALPESYAYSIVYSCVHCRHRFSLDMMRGPSNEAKHCMLLHHSVLCNSKGCQMPTCCRKRDKQRERGRRCRGVSCLAGSDRPSGLAVQPSRLCTSVH